MRPGQAELSDIIESPCCGLVHTYTLQALGDFMRGQWLLPVALARKDGREPFTSHKLDGSRAVLTHVGEQCDRIAG
ncbi:hypothetical protein D3C73_1607100 [compost metagenome]